MNMWIFRKNQEDYNNSGGFDVADDEVEERRARIAGFTQQSLFIFIAIIFNLCLERDREAQTSQKPDQCVDCDRPLIKAYLWDTFSHPVCDVCK